MVAQSESHTDKLVVASEYKLRQTAESLQKALRKNKRPWVPQLFPCQSPHGYRNRCSFQILQQEEGTFRLAVREAGKPVVIDNFPLANRRIQDGMKSLLTFLNDRDNPLQAALVDHLTSVTFATSWNPSHCCHVTLHYEAPLSEGWCTIARQMATSLGWQQVTGRSKGQVERALLSESEPFLPDDVYLQRQNHGWKVSLDRDALDPDNLPSPLSVHYVKPESAFSHPNPTVMCQALTWILDRIEIISTAMFLSTETMTRRPTLLELYCGCGAHTMALIRSGLLHRIVAVELDERLVQACIRNADVNRCQENIEIISQDAAKCSGTASDPSILLVDPPRQGLDARVCRMAVQNTQLQHMLYISCGREALVRDLQILGDSFEIVDCVLLDLFPQTFSVETLVHLQRTR